MYLKTDILFTTTGSVSGREITDYLGILIKREVVSADVDSREKLYEIDARYAYLAAAMNAHAADIGADAVVGVDFRMDMLGDKVIFTMTGNAVRLRDSAVMPGPVSREEEIAEIEALDAEEKDIAELDAEFEALDAEEEDIAGLDAEFEALEAEEKDIAELDAEFETLEAEEKDIAELDAEFEALDAEEEIPDVLIFEEAEPEKKEAAASWLCASCGTENEEQYRFCPRCGEKRMLDWKCDGCGQQNPPEYKFCPGCGRPCNG